MNDREEMQYTLNSSAQNCIAIQYRGVNCNCCSVCQALQSIQSIVQECYSTSLLQYTPALYSCSSSCNVLQQEVKGTQLCPSCFRHFRHSSSSSSSSSSIISKFFSWYHHSPESHQSSRLTSTHSSHSVNLNTSRASCDAKKGSNQCMNGQRKRFQEQIGYNAASTALCNVLSWSIECRCWTISHHLSQGKEGAAGRMELSHVLASLVFG